MPDLVDHQSISHTIDEFIADLTRRQKEINARRRAMAEEIVEGQKLETLEDAKLFARNWIETAAQYATNEEYWRERAHVAEKGLGLTPKSG